MTSTVMIHPATHSQENAGLFSAYRYIKSSLGTFHTGNCTLAITKSQGYIFLWGGGGDSKEVV